MIEYLDTSFLCALYREQTNADKARAYMQTTSPSVLVSELLILEFRQSVRWQIYLHSRDHSKGYRAIEGEQMLRDFQSDLAAGIFVTTPVEWPHVHHMAEGLSFKYTQTQGLRFADMLHLATGMYLGIDTFLTFDTKQKFVAQAEGIDVPV